MLRKFSVLADMGYNPDGSPMAVDFEHNDNIDLNNDFSGLSTLKNQDSSMLSDPLASPAAATAEKIVAEYVTLPLDHFDTNKKGDARATFENRYWVAESGYRAGGPVFVYDVGEGDGGPNALFRLQNETSFFKQIVDAFGGIGIVWEHRFCTCAHEKASWHCYAMPWQEDGKLIAPDGNSTPVTINLDTPPSAFEFLTTEQSLADVDCFAKQFRRSKINATLTPDQTPWVFIGGSYPAMRAAFMRNRYPDTIYASYASSAPVQASIDQSFYFEPVFRGLVAKGFGNCTQDLRAAIRYMDTVMDGDASAAAQLKVQFLGLGAEKNSHATFADALATVFSLWQSYGVEGGALGLRRLCDWIETDPETNATAPADGFAASRGAHFTVARWASYPSFAPGVNQYLETNCSGRVNVTATCDLDRRFTDPASISWAWQYCTQWGSSCSSEKIPHDRDRLTKHRTQASSNPPTSAPINSSASSTPLRTSATFATANSPTPRAPSSPTGRSSTVRTVSLAAGPSGPPTPTGPTANSTPGAPSRPPRQSPLHPASSCSPTRSRRVAKRSVQASCLAMCSRMRSIALISAPRASRCRAARRVGLFSRLRWPRGWAASSRRGRGMGGGGLRRWVDLVSQVQHSGNSLPWSTVAQSGLVARPGLLLGN